VDRLRRQLSIYDYRRAPRLGTKKPRPCGALSARLRKSLRVFLRPEKQGGRGARAGRTDQVRARRSRKNLRAVYENSKNHTAGRRHRRARRAQGRGELERLRFAKDAAAGGRRNRLELPGRGKKVS